MPKENYIIVNNKNLKTEDHPTLSDEEIEVNVEWYISEFFDIFWDTALEYGFNEARHIIRLGFRSQDPGRPEYRGSLLDRLGLD